MTDWKTILAGADDEYLAGLSNKGTVKRAHKDRETTPCEILDTGDQGINVKLGEEELLIAPVLAESRCSCPSRSICRHIVQAILVLKDMYEAGEGGIKEEKKEKSEALPSEELWQAVLEIGNQKIIRALGMKKLGGEKGRYRSFQHGFGGASGFRVSGKISASAGIFLLYLQKEGILRSQGCCGFVVPYGGGNSAFGGI